MSKYPKSQHHLVRDGGLRAQHEDRHEVRGQIQTLFLVTGNSSKWILRRVNKGQSKSTARRVCAWPALDTGLIPDTT